MAKAPSTTNNPPTQAQACTKVATHVTYGQGTKGGAVQSYRAEHKGGGGSTG